MRRISVLSFLTLDGVIQAPGGPDEDPSGGFKFGGWVVPYSDETLGEAMDEQMRQPFSLLLGRKTFEIFASYWPQHEDVWPGINDAEKYVVSNTLTEPGWNNSFVIGGDVAGQIRALKSGDGPHLQVYGSGNLVQTLLKQDLVDELRLKIFPITLGGGKRLFEDGAIPAAFRLAGSSISATGVIVADYERAGDVETGSF